MNRRRLLMDAGNSRLKWVVVEAGQWHTQGASDYTDWSALQVQLTAGTDCFIASVANPVHEQQLAALLEAAGLGRQPCRVEARRFQQRGKLLFLQGACHAGDEAIGAGGQLRLQG